MDTDKKMMWIAAYLVAMHANIRNDPTKDSETAGMESAEDANEAVLRFEDFSKQTEGT